MNLKFIIILLNFISLVKESKSQSGITPLKAKEFSPLQVILIAELPTEDSDQPVHILQNDSAFIAQSIKYNSKLDSCWCAVEKLNEKYSNRDFYYTVLTGGETVTYYGIRMALCYGKSYDLSKIEIVKLDKTRGNPNDKKYYKDDLWLK